VIYSPEGWRVEEYEFAADGRELSHEIITRDCWRILTIEGYFADDARNYSTVYSWDGNFARERVTYAADGSVQSRSTSTQERMEEVSYKPDGSLANKVIQNYDPANRTNELLIFNGSEPAPRRWVLHYNPDGSVEHANYDTDGRLENTRVDTPDGWQRTLIVAPDGQTSTSYQRNDKAGHILEAGFDSPTSYSRTVYRYDKSGNPTAILNYDRAGKIERKVSYAYEFDSHGNWIEQTELLRTRESRSPKLVSRTTRLITYY
jgi:antitoxin component YwqK of YwqJK toxin-antitoxin module